MDFRAAPCIARALAKRCSYENWGYLEIPHEYTDATVAWNRKRYGLVIDPETVVFSTGVHAGIISALRAFSRPGCRVLLNTPTYIGPPSSFLSLDGADWPQDSHKIACQRGVVSAYNRRERIW